MSTLGEVRFVLASSLQLDDRAESFSESTELLGSLPELDSFAVVTLITALEEHFGLVVEDDEITAEVFETLGSLSEFVDTKIGS